MTQNVVSSLKNKNRVSFCSYYRVFVSFFTTVSDDYFIISLRDFLVAFNAHTVDQCDNGVQVCEL